MVRLAEMEEELSACTRNGFKTEITLTTQCSLAFISAFDKMGLFVPGALVEDRVKRGNSDGQNRVILRIDSFVFEYFKNRVQYSNTEY